MTANVLAPMSAGLTHPDCAALVDPLFRFAGKRVAALFVLLTNIFFCYAILYQYPYYQINQFYTNEWNKYTAQAINQQVAAQ